ncbi:Na-translocating system protein MpsC family protein [Paenibacillus flagellatus]|nr:Na-translocating system protein MpsC family protein [Paenibacillus flagellatus]
MDAQADMKAEPIHRRLQYISSYTGKLLRQKFGRGPEACFAFAGGPFLLIEIGGFVTPMEEALFRQGQSIAVDTVRQAIMTGILEELKGVIQSMLELEVRMMFHDWNFPNNSGLIAAALDRELPTEAPKTPSFEPDYRLVEHEVSRLSALVQKVPEEVRTYRINERFCVVIRRGILVPIEKALIAKGYEQELLNTKDDLEKTYFHRDGTFSDLFRAPVADIFLDWSFPNDLGFICFVLESRR